jgi:nitrogen regulatory protein PII
MKKIEAIIRPEKLEAVVEKLGQLGYSGLHFSEVQGHGRQKGMKELFRGREYDVKFIPKVKIELVLSDAKAEQVISTIIDTAQTGQIGDGKIFVSEISDVIRVRTKERGEVAI